MSSFFYFSLKFESQSGKGIFEARAAREPLVAIAMGSHDGIKFDI